MKSINTLWENFGKTRTTEDAAKFIFPKDVFVVFNNLTNQILKNQFNNLAKKTLKLSFWI